MPGQDYADRPCVYAIVFGEAGRIAVVRSARGHYLPGGGIGPGESREAALARECLEECGRGLAIGAHVGDAVQYLDVPGEGHLRLLGSFFLGRFTAAGPAAGEPDHALVWLSAEEAALRMTRPFEAWAIGRATES